MDTLFRYLQNDLTNCGELFTELSSLVRAEAWDGATSTVAKLKQVLSRHVEIEENLVFKPFDKLLSYEYSPTRDLSADHQRIAGVLERVEEVVLQRDSGEYAKHATTLRIALMVHLEKELSTFYPLVEKMLTPQLDTLNLSLRHYQPLAA